jgi:HlyD family secretion protein
MKRFLKNRKLVIGVALVVLLAIVAAWPASVPVDVARVERGRLEVTVDDEGETRVRERFVISAPVPGRVLRIDLEPGDKVEHGRTLLATFLSGASAPLDARTRAEAQAALDAARAALGRAKADETRLHAALERTNAELTRIQALAKEQLVSRDELEGREADVRLASEAARAARFAAREAEHNVAMAGARAQSFGLAPGGAATITIKSPIDGVVLKRLRESESVVPAGEPLLELGDPQALEIVADFLSSDAVRIKEGNAVRIERWGGAKELNGRVRRVEPSGFMKISALGVEEQRVNVIINLVDPVAAWQRLGDGYRVEVSVLVWQAENVLKAPTSSLIRRGEGWSVFVVAGKKARPRAIEVGERNELQAEIRSGLSPGETVIVHPPDSLSAGSRITIRR